MADALALNVQACMYDVTGAQPCSVWCRHHPAASKGGCVCPFAERQDVADHGPAPFVPAPPPVTPPAPDPAAPVGEFGRAAARTLDECRAVFDERGTTYGDTWAIGPTFGCADDADRLADCGALVRVKMRRALSARLTHRDSLLDLINYAAAYVTWADETGAWA